MNLPSALVNNRAKEGSTSSGRLYCSYEVTGVDLGEISVLNETRVTTERVEGVIYQQTDLRDESALKRRVRVRVVL